MCALALHTTARTKLRHKKSVELRYAHCTHNALHDPRALWPGHVYVGVGRSRELVVGTKGRWTKRERAA